MQGLIALDGNNQLLSRTSSIGPIALTSNSGNYTIWFSVLDDNTQAIDLTVNKIKFSKHINDFNEALEYDLNFSSTPQVEDGYFDNSVNYYYNAYFPIDSFIGYSQVFVRMYVKDAHNDTTEIPSNGSLTYIKDYFSLMMP